MRDLRQGLVAALIANLLSKPVWLLTDTFVQDRIGHQAYGLIGALLGLGQWASALADWGLYALVTREMARSRSLYPHLSQHTLSLKLILTLLSAGGFLLLGYLLGYRGHSFSWLGLLVGYQLSLSYLQYFRSFFQGDQRFQIDALLSALEKGLVLFLLFLLWDRLAGDLYVWILFTAGAVSAALAGVWVIRRYGLPTLQVDWAALWATFRRMTPFALMGYATTFNERINQILLERWIGSYENGLYWGAYRWFSAAMMYLWIVMPVFFARFALLGRQRTIQLWRTLLWGQLVASWPLIAVAGTFLALPEVFLLFFSHSSPAEKLHMQAILQVLAIPLILNGLSIIYSTYLTAVGYEWAAFGLMVAASLVNGLSSGVLLPLYKGVGAALSLGLSYAAYGVGFILLLERVGPVPVPWTLLGRLAGFAVSYGLSAWGLNHLELQLSYKALLLVGILAGWSGLWKIPQLWRRASRLR